MARKQAEGALCGLLVALFLLQTSASSSGQTCQNRLADSNSSNQKGQHVPMILEPDHQEPQLEACLPGSVGHQNGQDPTSATGNIYPAPELDLKKNRKVGPAFWRWLYVQELRQEFTLLRREKTMDERLSNIAYTTSTSRTKMIDYHTYNTGDKKQDILLEQQSAGSRVDDKLCDKHLKEMADDLNELEKIVALKRSNANDQFEEKHYRLARVLDSFGHYESGYFSGRTHSLGSWEQCIKSQQVLSKEGAVPREEVQQLVDSRFCWAKLSLAKHLHPSLAQRRPSKFESSFTGLQVGVCIPATCHSRNFHTNRNRRLLQKLIDSQFKLPRSIYVDENLQLDSVFCDVDRDSPLFGLPLSGKLFLACLGAYVLLTIYATKKVAELESFEKHQAEDGETKVTQTIEEASEKTSRKVERPERLIGVFECLDLRASWRELIGCDYRIFQAGSIDINSLNPIRCLACVTVVWAHEMMLKSSHSMGFLRDLNNYENKVQGPISLIISNLVDTFFTISGILMAYFTLKGIRRANGRRITAVADAKQERPPTNLQLSEENQSSHQVKLEDTDTAMRLRLMVNQFVNGIFHILRARYLRLVPLFAIVYYFKRTVVLYMGSGPFWDYGFNKETYYGACHRENWLTPFIFSTSSLPLSKQCLMQSWSISSDMIYTIVIAPILIIMSRRPKLAIFMGLSLCVISAIFTLEAASRLDDEDDFLLKDLSAPGVSLTVNKLSYIITGLRFRIYPSIVGMIAGYLMSKCEFSDQKYQWPIWFTGHATIGSSLYLVSYITLTLLGPSFKDSIRPYHMYVLPFFITLNRVLWATANATICLRMMTDWKDTSLIRTFRNRFWYSLAKLSYALLLIHYELIIWEENETSTQVTTRWAITRSVCVVLMLALPISIFLNVFIENPMEKLVRKYVLNKRPSSSDKVHGQ